MLPLLSLIKGKEDVERYDFQHLSDYLLSSRNQEEVTETFQGNLINGEPFLYLSEEDPEELLPVIRDRILIRKLLKKLHEVVINLFMHKN